MIAMLRNACPYDRSGADLSLYKLLSNAFGFFKHNVIVPNVVRSLVSHRKYGINNIETEESHHLYHMVQVFLEQIWILIPL